MSLSQSLDLYLVDKLAHRFAGIGLLGRKPDAGRRLRQHGFSKMAMQMYRLGLAREAEDHRIRRPSCLFYTCYSCLEYSSIFNDLHYSFELSFTLV